MASEQPSPPEGSPAPAVGSPPPADTAKAPRQSAKEKREAAEAFTEKFNSTPATCSEAEQFRTVDDRFKSLKHEAVTAVKVACGNEADLPPEVITTFKCWCYLHGEEPSLEKCAQLAGDPEDFKLVGTTSIKCLSEEEFGALKGHIDGLDPSTVRTRPLAVAEPAAAMLEWMQAAVALHLWAAAQQAANK
eukprot:TRINITY_DN15245_c2_g1_i1.p2 TRINITY_DN15245_c2_g1~~TRINITY_DN15245_c2_g1_i1.p2  ORF type:complete len:190 (+),score=41.90 TRINITY_DN15245_c2_g1_i1:94-663(+)